MSFTSDTRGERHPRFNGGVYVNGNGYLRISAGPLRGKYVHVLVLEAKLGRRLEPHEESHHINGDRLDCRPENLEVRLVEEHRAYLNAPNWRVRNGDSGATRAR